MSEALSGERTARASGVRPVSAVHAAKSVAASDRCGMLHKTADAKQAPPAPAVKVARQNSLALREKACAERQSVITL